MTGRRKTTASWNARPKKVMTADELNDINRAFWEKRALVERVEAATGLTEKQKRLLLERAPRTIDERIKAERQAEEDRKLGQKFREHAKRGQAIQSSAANAKAEAFVKAVAALRKTNASLSQTSAVRQLAKRRNVSESTAWEYMKRAKNHSG